MFPVCPNLRRLSTSCEDHSVFIDYIINYIMLTKNNIMICLIIFVIFFELFVGFLYLPDLPVLFGCETGLLFEHLGEIALVFISTGNRNLHDRIVCVGQEPRRLFNADAV